MAEKSSLDKYPQWFVVGINGLAAASGSEVARLTTGLTNLQKIAWAVKRIEYRFPAAWIAHGVLAAADDLFSLGLTNSGDTNQVPTYLNPALLDMVEVTGRAGITAVGVTSIVELPIVHDYSDEILCLPQNLFIHLAWDTTGNLTTDQAQIRAWYREVELGPQDWYDLLQLRLPLGAL